MGWLNGLLSGYNETMGDIRRENAVKAEQAAQREGRVYEALLNSPDDEIRTMAATGLVQGIQPRKNKSGMQGWFGEMQSSPIYPQLLKYMQTPKPTTTETTSPGVPSRPTTQGFLPKAPGQDPTLAQPETSPTEGEPMAKPQPIPEAPAQPAAEAPPPTGAYGFSPPPAPPVGFAQGQPSPTLSPLLRKPPPGGYIIDEGTQPTPPPTPPVSAAAPAQPAAAAAAPTPPPTPPAGMLTAAPNKGYTPGPTTTTRQTTYALPHAFPTAEDQETAKSRALVHGQIAALQEAYKTQGDPDWQKKGIDAYMARSTRAGALPYRQVNVEYIDPATGQIVQDLASYDQANGLYYAQDGSILPADARPVPKAAAGQPPSNLQDQAAKAMGFPNYAAVPASEAARFQQTYNALKTAQSAAGAAGSTRGKYQEEQSRIDPANVGNAAAAIMSDVSMTAVFLNGRSQAFKDAVSNEITRRGGDVNKLSDGARQMAEMAKDILPTMDIIAKDATEFNRLGMMGPLAGRWQDFLTGKIGMSELAGNDPAKVALAGKFRTEVDLLQKAVARAHAGVRGAGSPQMLEGMDNMLSGARMDLGTFLSSMSGFKVWMDQYAKHLPEFGTAGQEVDPNAPPSGAPPAPPVASQPTGTGLIMRNGVLSYPDGRPF